MLEKDKKTLTRLAKKYSHEMPEVLQTILDQYSRDTLGIYAAIIYRERAFDKNGQLLHPEKKFSTNLATSILGNLNRRKKIVATEVGRIAENHLIQCA